MDIEVNIVRDRAQDAWDSIGSSLGRLVTIVAVTGSFMTGCANSDHASAGDPMASSVTVSGQINILDGELKSRDMELRNELLEIKAEQNNQRETSKRIEEKLDVLGSKNPEYQNYLKRANEKDKEKVNRGPEWRSR